MASPTTPPRQNVPARKGALVTLPSSGPETVIYFQYNPETLRRSLTPSTVGGEGGDRSRAVRFSGAPVQTVSVEIQLDATEGLDQGDPVSGAEGIYPQIAALEVLLYPSLEQVTGYAQALERGVLEVVPMTAPRTHFVWGDHRVLPVRLTSLAVTEELFGANLAPIQATVDVEMRVLSYSDLYPTSADYQTFLTYQAELETVARLAAQPTSVPRS